MPIKHATLGPIIGGPEWQQDHDLSTLTLDEIGAGVVNKQFTAVLEAKLAGIGAGADISGTGVIGQVAEFVTNTKTLQAAKLIPPAVNILTLTNAAASTLALNITAGKTLTLTAADNYTLTIPATGTAALLATANVFTAAQKINVNSTTALLVEQDGVKDNTFVVDTTNALVGINTDSFFSGLTVKGGKQFTTIPAFGVASIGSINSTTGWNGSGFLFSNSVSGTKAFSMVYNGDIAYFGGLDASTSAIWMQLTAAGLRTPKIGIGKNPTSIALDIAGGITATEVITTAGKIAVTNASTPTNGLSIANSSSHDWRIWAKASTIGLVIGASDENLFFWEGKYSASPANLFNSPVGNGVVITEILGKTTTNGAIYTVSKLTAQVSTASTGGAAGFGVGQSFWAETATDGTNQQQGLISTAWTDATNATRKAKLSLSAYDTAARLGLEIQASGTESMIGFHGVTPIARAVLATGAGATVDDVITALQNLGLVKQS